MSDISWIRSARGEISTSGAHVARWRHDDAEVLFVSRKSRFEVGQAIRGGIPVIFPWFGDDPEQRGRGAHGFARRAVWSTVEQTNTPDSLRATLELVDDDNTRAAWPHRFALRLEVVLGDTLDIALHVHNRDEQPFKCELALHTYFAVGDVRAIALRGLEGARYLDKLDAFREKTESRSPLTFSGPVDRVYLGTESTCSIEDPVFGRDIEITKSGSRSTVVWNPWIAGAARLTDLREDEWTGFLCVETANIGPDAPLVAPGQTHTMRLRIAVTAGS